MISKGDLMKLTGNDTNVDSALPEAWLQNVEKMGFDRHDILYSYGYSYRKSLFGKPLNLSVEFIKLLDKTPIETHYSLLDFIVSYLKNPEYWEIHMK